MKKVIGLILMVVGLTAIQPVQAEEVKTIAIIDTAVDSSKNKNIVYEVCFTISTCPNKTSFQEGVGAANVNDWTIKGVDHGFNVSQAAVLTNPNVKIIFIRISDENKYEKFSAIHNDASSLDRAITWVSENSTKFNIRAVSISQSRVNFAAGTCPKDVVFESAVKSLNGKNIPTFVATGNESKKNQVGFPACIDGVYGVGALKPASGKKPFPASAYTTFASYTNVGPGLDIVAKGDADIISYKGSLNTVVGTSIATPQAATLFVSKAGSQTLDDFLKSLPKSENYPYIS